MVNKGVSLEKELSNFITSLEKTLQAKGLPKEGFNK
jgi:hypothetical protein